MGLQGCSWLKESHAAGEPIPRAKAAKAKPEKSYIEEAYLVHCLYQPVLNSYSLPSFEHSQLVKSFQSFSSRSFESFQQLESF